MIHGGRTGNGVPAYEAFSPGSFDYNGTIARNDRVPSSGLSIARSPTRDVSNAQ